MLEYGEASEKRSCFGEATYAEVPPNLMHEVVKEINSLEDLKVYLQSMGNCTVKTLIAQKMESKPRSYQDQQKNHVVERRPEHVSDI